MLRKTIPALLLAGTLLAIGCDSNDEEDRGTAAEAQQMVTDAIAYFDANSDEAAFTKFTDNPAPEFKDRDLYVFVVDVADSLVKAHGSDKAMVGTNVTETIDVDGKNIGEALLSNATVSGAWVDYKWNDPITNETHAKRSWVRRHEGHIFGVGIYTP